MKSLESEDSGRGSWLEHAQGVGRRGGANVCGGEFGAQFSETVPPVKRGSGSVRLATETRRVLLPAGRSDVDVGGDNAGNYFGVPRDRPAKDRVVSGPAARRGSHRPDDPPSAQQQ